jgi:uncharacterized protein (UPF0548 family)
VGDAQRQLNRLAELPLTYPERGATALPELPGGYGTLQRSRVLGSGAEVFERAAAGLMSWRMHHRAGLGIEADSPTAVPGSNVVVIIGRRPLALTAPCRVVYDVTEPRRRGFAYGTLPGHPESGEEAFVVTLDGDGQVVFTVRAFSRPASRLARLGGPVTRLAQDLATRRYLSALHSIARAAPRS